MKLAERFTDSELSLIVFAISDNELFSFNPDGSQAAYRSLFSDETMSKHTFSELFIALSGMYSPSADALQEKLRDIYHSTNA